MSGPAPVRLTLLAAGACVALAGCGSDDSGAGELPPDTAEQLRQSLEDLETAQASEDCPSAEAAASEFSNQVQALGDDVDESIRDSLDQGAEQVNDLVGRQLCEPSGTTDEEIATETVPTTTETVPTTTETAEETTTATEPEEEEEDGEDGETQPPAEEEAPTEQPSGEGGPSGGTESGDGGVGAEE